MPTLESLRDERYVSLETYRKNGSAVATPIWLASDGADGAVAYTGLKSYKVARLRRNSDARIAACDARGNVHGEWLDVSVSVVDSNDSADIYEAIRQKYGIQKWLIDFFNRFRAKQRDTVGLVISNR